MTTTTAMDGGPADELLPPKRSDVLKELKALRARDGITPDKVGAKGFSLQRLDISQDELLRTGGESADIPIATVKALHCVVESYRQQENEVGGIDDARWIVLRHELNLDQSFGFDLGQRQDLAKEVLRFGGDEYKKRSSAILDWYSYDIVQLRESKCRPPGDWESREALRIVKLPSWQEQYDEIYNLLKLSPIAHRDRTSLKTSIARGLPTLFGELERVDWTVMPPDAANYPDAISANFRVVGETAYVGYAALNDVGSGLDETLLPWQVLANFVMTSMWPGESEYSNAGSTLEAMLAKGERFPLSVDHRRRYDELHYLFVDPMKRLVTEVFSEALESSLQILAELVVSDDHEQERARSMWAVERPDERWSIEKRFIKSEKVHLDYEADLLDEILFDRDSSNLDKGKN